MERLIAGMGENSAEGYDQIYLTRKEHGVDLFDMKRWKKLLKYYKGGKLLDMGCLDSLIPKLVHNAYPKAEVWGIDVAEDAIKDMQRRFPKAIFKVEDAYNTHFPANYFDYVVAGEIIEHMDDPAKFIKEAFRVLKHGGVLALSTPFGEAREPGAVDAHRHVWSFEIEDVDSLLTKHGKVMIRTIGSQYFPTYIYHWPTILAFCFKK